MESQNLPWVLFASVFAVDLVSRRSCFWRLLLVSYVGKLLPIKLEDDEHFSLAESATTALGASDADVKTACQALQVFFYADVKNATIGCNVKF